jgi:F0F1-type ATP synthase delta subunit
MAAHETDMQLPVLLTGRTDLVRLRRELESLEDYLHQAALRKETPDHLKLPKTSRMLDAFAADNKLDLLHRADHEKAQTAIDTMLAHAPQMHISFSVEPSSAFLAKLVTWLRQNIHPQVLVHVGLQPGIAAGCIVRTQNKQFDLSLRHSFEKNRGLLVTQLGMERKA